MKKWIAMAVAGMAFASAAQARNVTYVEPIANALQSAQAQARIAPSVRLFFGPQQPPAGETRGSGNARGKERIEEMDEKASCQASFAEALQQLQQRAIAQGANAIININSYFKNGPRMSSTTQFECHAGTNNTGVMLQGDFVRLPN